MASVIRVNTINSRSGLSTVTFDNSGAGIEVAGVATATSFSGTASGNPTLANGSNNRVITATGSNALTGETNFTYDGQTATINGTSNDTPLIVDTTNSNGAHMRFRTNGSSQHFVGSGGGISLGDNEDLSFRAYDNIRIATGNNSTERFRIKSDGKVLVGSGCTDASTFNVKGSAGFADDGTNAGLIISTDDANGAALSCLTAGGFVGGSYGVMRLNALQHKFTYGNTVRLNIKSDGDIETDGNLKTNNLFGRNLIINGDFQISQRATTNNTAGAQSTYHTLDRWMTQIQAGTITESQQSLSSSDTGPWQKGLRKYMRMLNQSGIGAGAAQYAEIDQRIEAQTLAQSGWDYNDSAKYITLSFWLRASVAQSYVVVMYTNDGTGRHFPFEVALSANTWTKVEKAIPGNSGITFNNDNGQGCAICFIASYGTNYTSNSGSFNTWNTTGNGLNRWPDMTTTWATTANATFDVTGVQLEVGSIATEFEHRSYAEELRRCQRYYYVHASGVNKPVCTSANYAASSVFGLIQFPVEMRTNGALDKVTGTDYFRIYSNGTDDLFDNVAQQATSSNGFILQCDTNVNVTAGQSSWVQTANANAKIAFKAEL